MSPEHHQRLADVQRASVHGAVLDCREGVPSRAIVSGLIPWAGAHGSYSGSRRIMAMTPFGAALVQLRGSHSDQGERLWIDDVLVYG